MESSDALKLAVEAIQEEFRRPFTISLIGPTGTGKTSLLNALFRTQFLVSDDRPCTTEPNVHELTRKGATLRFVDLPGYGESSEIDDSRTEIWKSHLDNSDIIIMTIFAISRSIDFDLNWLQNLYSGELPNNLLVVATHSDMLRVKDGWIISLDEETIDSTPSPDLLELIGRKKKYIRERVSAISTSETPVIYCSSISGYNLLELATQIHQRVPEEAQIAFSSLLVNPKKIGIVPRHHSDQFVPNVFINKVREELLFNSDKFR